MKTVLLICTLLSITFATNHSALRFLQVDEISAVLEVSLPRLSDYLHSELPERDTLYIYENYPEWAFLSVDLENHIVKTTHLEKAHPNTLMVSTSFRHSDSCKLYLTYPIEGIEAEVALKKSNGKWQVYEIVIRER